MLADLGADVAEYDPGDGWPAESGADVRAYRDAFGVGKRRVADVSGDLLASADIVICRDGREVPGLTGEGDFAHRFPRLILVTLSAFGATGPDAGRPASDLVSVARSGYLHMTGPDDGPPIKPSIPFFSWRFGSIHGLPGVLLALRRRRLTGKGGHVDIAARDVGLWMLTHTYQYWDMERVNLRRKGADRDVGRAGVRIPSLFECKDGTIIWILLSGQLGKGSVDRLVAWMAEDGLAPDWLQAIDWHTLRLEEIPDLAAFMQPFRDFFVTKTRVELLERAIRDGFMIAPVNDIGDLLGDPQLVARDAWAHRQLDDGDRILTRAPFKSTGITWNPGDRTA